MGNLALTQRREDVLESAVFTLNHKTNNGHDRLHMSFDSNAFTGLV